MLNLQTIIWNTTTVKEFTMKASIFLVLAIFISAAASNPGQQKSKFSPNSLLDELQEQIKEKDQELKHAEKINENFERVMQLVNILGQVDSFLTERTKNLVKKIALLIEDDQRNHHRDSFENE